MAVTQVEQQHLKVLDAISTVRTKKPAKRTTCRIRDSYSAYRSAPPNLSMSVANCNVHSQYKSLH
eukprot:3560209-Amphidinium_carterae.1